MATATAMGTALMAVLMAVAVLMVMIVIIFILFLGRRARKFRVTQSAIWRQPLRSAGVIMVWRWPLRSAAVVKVWRWPLSSAAVVKIWRWSLRSAVVINAVVKVWGRPLRLAGTARARRSFRFGFQGRTISSAPNIPCMLPVFRELPAENNKYIIKLSLKVIKRVEAEKTMTVDNNNLLRRI